jgi:L-fuculose-phosphate aldolase
MLSPMERTGRAHPAFDAAATAIVAAGRRLGARRLIAGCDGNLSVRLGPYALAITPAGRRKDELDVDDILAVPLEADPRTDAASGRRPSSDLAVHRAAYTARPEASALAHAHPPAVLACLLAGLRPDASVLPEAWAVLGRVAFVPALPFGSAAVAAAVGEVLRDPAVGAVLLDRHGALTLGRTLDEAVDRLEVVELLCATWQAAWLAAGDPRRRTLRRPVPGAARRTPSPVLRRP